MSSNSKVGYLVKRAFVSLPVFSKLSEKDLNMSKDQFLVH